MSVIGPEQLSSFTRLSHLVKALAAGEAIPVGQDLPWWEEGVIVEVSRDDYYDYLTRLPPRYMNGSYFAFGEGSDPFTLFWQGRNECFARRLSQAETEHFCRLGPVAIQL